MGARSTLRTELSAPVQAVASLVLICGRRDRNEKSSTNDPHSTYSHIPYPVWPYGLGRIETMTEIINDIVAQIDQIIFWLRVTVYLVLGICVVWLIGFIRRNLGLDTHSIELKRIRRILERHTSDK